MKKETKIFILISVILVAVLTAIDIQTKGKITSLVGSVNPMNLKSSDVPYTNNDQSNVQGAIDSLYTGLTTCQSQLSSAIDPTSIDISTLKINNTKKILASSAGICIKRNGTVSCMKRDNWGVEKDHIQQIFSDISCDVGSSYVSCSASDFYCIVSSGGYVRCNDGSDGSSCIVLSGGSVNCS